jgi:glycosyltransferase involved in cell wall biosynthesis
MRTLLVINATVHQPAVAEAAEHHPRKDYAELQRRLAADVLDLAAVRRRLPARLLSRVIGTAVVQAAMAWTRAARYDAIFVDRESAGSILAALCSLGRRRPRLVVIGHLLSSRRKRLLLRLLGIRRTLDCVIVHSSQQQRAAEELVGLRPEQVALVPYQTDERFWRPKPARLKRQICSAGLEYRDYETLVEAVRDLDVEVVIAAASHWSKHQMQAGTQPLPPTVRVVSLDYPALRDLYAESLFVVVPLREVDNQAGITTILEAMAMGKAVVVSHTVGQTDVVRDRRRVSRSDPQRTTQPDWALSLGAASEAALGHTGIYVRPGDATELRRAIDFLLTHPEEVQLMGANGRRLIERAMGLDHFVARVADLMGVEPAASVPAPAGSAVSAV